MQDESAAICIRPNCVGVEVYETRYYGKPTDIDCRIGFKLRRLANGDDSVTLDPHIGYDGGQILTRIDIATCEQRYGRRRFRWPAACWKQSTEKEEDTTCYTHVIHPPVN